MDKNNVTQEAANAKAVNNGRKILTYNDLTEKLTELTDTVQDKMNELYDIIQCLSIIDPIRKGFCSEMDSYLEEMNLAMDELHFAVGRYVEEGK